MGRFVDISGKRFGRLTAIRPTQGRDSGGRVLWEFMCDCGTTKVIRPNGVIEGRVQSCGCLHKEKAAQQGRSKRTHGREPQRLYNIWCGLKERCYNVNSPKYMNYGRRGITVYDGWMHDFKALKDWAMANGYKDGLTIDRIDNDGNYEPSNCRWATQKQQQRNRSNNHVIEIDGVRACISEHAERLGISVNTLKNRVRCGYDLTAPYKHGKRC